MTTIHLLAAGDILVSWYKPLLVVATFTLWLRVISSVFDKDAARWYFQRETWNLGHIAAGALAIAVIVFTPGENAFWIAWPLTIVILGGDLLLYFFLRNADDRVPERAKWPLNPMAWAASAKASSDGKKSKDKSKQTKGIQLALAGPNGQLPSPEPETPEFAARTKAEEYLMRTQELRGTQLDIAPVGSDAYGVACLVDGVPTPIERVAAPLGVATIDCLKAAAGLDLKDRRRRLTGPFSFGPPGGPMVDCVLTTKGAKAGMSATVALDPTSQVQRRIEDLGLLDTQMDELKKIIAEGQGVVLLASPPKHGRTSMLYAMIRAHDAYTSNVQTLELEPQAVIEGVRQNEFKVDTEDAEFATTVRSLLRRDPDVLGIAELPDEQTAQTVARADHKHTRTYVSVKADTAVQAIQLWCRLVGDQEQAAKALHGVVAHKLLRKLSDNAKIPFQPSPEMLKKLGLPKDVKTLYRTEGMVMVKDKMVPDPISNGTGYYGQIAAFAVHPIGEAERKLIASNDLNGLRAVFRQNKQPSVQTSAMQRVVMGETSVDEVLRVIEGKAPKKKAPAGGAGQAAQQAQPAAAKR